MDEKIEKLGFGKISKLFMPSNKLAYEGNKIRPLNDLIVAQISLKL